VLILSWNIKEEIVGQLAAITRVGRALCRRGTPLGSFVTLAREGARASRPTQRLRQGNSLSATPVNTRDVDD